MKDYGKLEVKLCFCRMEVMSLNQSVKVKWMKPRIKVIASISTAYFLQDFAGVSF